MITHARFKDIAEVDKFLNKAGLRLDEVQITHTVNRGGGFYMVFYDDPEAGAKTKQSKEEDK